VLAEGGILVDCTLGLGGHSEAFLERFANIQLVGIDRDPKALELAGERLARFGSRVHLVHAVYDEIEDVLAELDFDGADAILMDLGVSSMQLDEADRGFAYSYEAPLDKVGNPDKPNAVIDSNLVPGDIYVVPFNNAEALERMFKKKGKNIACFIVEPVLENLAIVLPDEGYLERVRELCDQYGIVLIFDEVKTGLTAGARGAAQRLGVQPDLLTLAKSIGGGLTLAAFGGKKKYMDYITNGKMAHFGTFNGNPLAMAGVRAVDKVCTTEALAKAEAFNQQALDRISEIIKEYELPAHTVGFGVKGCITWSTTPVRNYRDYKATNFEIAELSWLWSLNRGIITPPGLDEQWLISLAHGQREIDVLVEDFRELAVALRS
jgi:glutamate-1-semialdehyde 2,1-aminomutase